MWDKDFRWAVTGQKDLKSHQLRAEWPLATREYWAHSEPGAGHECRSSAGR